MTAAEPPRRSRRIKHLVSSQPVQYDDEIDGEDYEDDSDDYEEHTPKKRKLTQKTKNSKKQKTTQSGNEFKDLRDEFEEHYLFQAMVDPEVSVVELANDWVDQYKNNKDLAKKDLINFILNAVGCFTKIEEHDVANNESASETVGEIQTFFKRQKVHDFYLTSKKPEFKQLYKNFAQFMTQMIVISDEKGLLYDNIVIADEDEEAEEPEDTNIIEDLLVWLSSFSVTSVRALRYISTTSLFLIESALCKTVTKNNTSLEKFKHQLHVEQGKKQTATAKKRMNQIEQNIELYTNQSIILENFIQDIVNTTFIHRFKDVDHHIRANAMSYLGDWMMLYPEFFYKTTYLKYLGWVLSDNNSTVRLQVIKTLVKLLKHSVVVSGLRQFFERFKSRILEIAFHDVDIHVRANAIALLGEVNKIGFLEDDEISQLSSLIFNDKEDKIQHLIATLIISVEAERTAETTETIGSLMEKEQDKITPDLHSLIKFKNLISLLKDAHDRIEQPPKKDPKFQLPTYAKVGMFLAHEKRYLGCWSFLMDYYLLDNATVDELDEGIASLVKLDSSERSILLQLIYGLLIEDSEKFTDENSLELISKLQQLLKASEQIESDFSTFLKILRIFTIEFFEHHNQVEVFLNCCRSTAKHFKNNIIGSLGVDYINILKSVPSNTDSTSVYEIKTIFQDLIKELVLEVTNLLRSRKFSITDEVCAQLHDDFFYKLFILGANYDISSALSVFEHLKQPLYTLLPDLDIQLDKSSQSTVISSFKLFLSAITWKLNNLLHSNELYDTEVELKVIPDLLYEETEIIEEKGYPLSLRSEAAVCIIDLYTVIKNFQESYAQSEKENLSHFSRFFEISMSSLQFSTSAVDSLKDIFLRKEAQYASQLEITLERDDDEDISYNSMKADEGVDVWDLELGLCILARKLKSLYEIGMLPRDVMQRLRLNSEELGDLFESAVEIEDEEPQEEAQPEEHEDTVEETIPEIPLE
jgi:cohesin complex subunit SA-1/2